MQQPSCLVSDGAHELKEPPPGKRRREMQVTSSDGGFTSLKPYFGMRMTRAVCFTGKNKTSFFAVSETLWFMFETWKYAGFKILKTTESSGTFFSVILICSGFNNINGS